MKKNTTFFACLLAVFIGHVLYAQSINDLFKDRVPANPNISGSVTLTSSTLPIVVINTNGQTIVDDPKIVAHMGIIYNGSGIINNITDPFNEYNGSIGIEIRGNGSQFYPKKSYGFETLDALNEEADVSILGMPANSDWTLIATTFDKTLIRNSLMYKLWEKMGYYSVRTRYCEVVLNGIYVGVYTLTEKIKRGTNRVNVKKLVATDDITKISGGYIFKTDFLDPPDVNYWVSTLSNQNTSKNYIVFQPKPEDLSTDQFNYIRQYFTDFETVLASSNFSDPINGYRKYIDEGTFMDFFLVQEFTKNIDGYMASIYYHKDRNGKVKMGPIWDFDWAINYDSNPVTCTESDLTSGWMFRGSNCIAGLAQFWWERFLDDCQYTSTLRSRYRYLRSSSWSDTNVSNLIDSLANHLEIPMEREYEKWGLTIHGTTEINHLDEVTQMKAWILERLAWMDDNIDKIDDFEPILTSSNTNPTFGESIMLSTNDCPSGATVLWEWQLSNQQKGTFTSGSNTSLLVVPRDSITYKAKFIYANNSCNSYYSNPVVMNVASDCNSEINMIETISSPITPSAYFKSVNLIQASGRVENNTNVKFQSQKSIVFLPGFSSEQGGVISAEIKICN